MANVQSGNSVSVDAAGEVSSVPTNVLQIILTATTANAVLILKDASTDTKKIELRLAAAGTSQSFHFEEAPLFFQGGIEVTSITNAVATIIFARKGN